MYQKVNGHIIPKSSIAVDYWKIKGDNKKYIHFLTHTHGDHVVGLTSSWNEPIFCSEITAFLLLKRFGIHRKWLNIMPLSENVLFEVSKTETFTVTTYDANHCPGSVMFYFQGSFGNVFYTGDFRLSEDILKICTKLSQKVDLLYLDNTFCSPECVFPSREECYNEILNTIKSFSDHKIVIGVRKLGKEKLLGQLGQDLNETITVSSEYYELCQALFATNVFSTYSLCKGDSRISAVPMDIITSQLREFKRILPTIGILPTALYEGCENRPTGDNLFIIPYSDHCSYAELIQFVSALKPSKVLPIVTCLRGPYNTDIKDRFDMSCFNPYLSSPVSLAEPSSLAQEDSSSKNDEIRFQLSLNISKRKKRQFSNLKKRRAAKGVVYEEDINLVSETKSDNSNVIELVSECEKSSAVCCEILYDNNEKRTTDCNSLTVPTFTPDKTIAISTKRKKCAISDPNTNQLLDNLQKIHSSYIAEENTSQLKKKALPCSPRNQANINSGTSAVHSTTNLLKTQDAVRELSRVSPYSLRSEAKKRSSTRTIQSSSPKPKKKRKKLITPVSGKIKEAESLMLSKLGIFKQNHSQSNSDNSKKTIWQNIDKMNLSQVDDKNFKLFFSSSIYSVIKPLKGRNKSSDNTTVAQKDSSSSQKKKIHSNQTPDVVNMSHKRAQSVKAENVQRTDVAIGEVVAPDVVSISSDRPLQSDVDVINNLISPSDCVSMKTENQGDTSQCSVVVLDSPKKTVNENNSPSIPSIDCKCLTDMKERAAPLCANINFCLNCFRKTFCHPSTNIDRSKCFLCNRKIRQHTVNHELHLKT